MANKRGLENNTRRAPSASTQKSCKGSSCQNSQKGNKAKDAYEEDEEDQANDFSSKEHPYLKNTSYSKKSCQVAQRPGEDEEDDDDDDDEDDDDEDYDEDNDEEEDDDEDDDEDEDEEERGGSLSGKKPSQYTLKYGTDSVISGKTRQSDNKNRCHAYQSNDFSQQGASSRKIENKTSSQSSRKNQPSSKKK